MVGSMSPKLSRAIQILTGLGHTVRSLGAMQLKCSCCDKYFWADRIHSAADVVSVECVPVRFLNIDRTTLRNKYIISQWKCWYRIWRSAGRPGDKSYSRYAMTINAMRLIGRKP